MIALFVHGYAIGVRSARGIERHCAEAVEAELAAVFALPDSPSVGKTPAAQ